MEEHISLMEEFYTEISDTYCKIVNTCMREITLKFPEILKHPEKDCTHNEAT